MLEQILRSEAVIRRLRAGPIADVVDKFVLDLEARGHASQCIADYVREVERFGHWTKRKGRDFASLDEAVIGGYLRAGGRSRPTKNTSAALTRLLVTLRSAGIAPAPRAAVQTAVDELVEAYLAHSVRCRGISRGTCSVQGRHVRQFLGSLVPPSRVKDPAAIQPADLIDYVTSLAGKGHPTAAKAAVSALRMFMRFLVLHRQCSDRLVQAVPTVRHREARLPRHLDADQVRRLLRALARPNAVGLRDHAVALCLVRLGLRVGEVVQLRLEDICWREGKMHIASTKSRRRTTVPLPHDVGRAFTRYLRDGRPATSDRHLFVTHLPPVGRALGSGAARAAIRRGFRRARLPVPFTGTHVLRHTLATQLVRRGVGLKEIADVLGHRSLDTTAVYARVDLPALKAVALPWPEVR